MPQRPLRLTFGPSRSGFFHGQHAGSGFRGRISEAWPHFSAPGAFMLGGVHTLCAAPNKNTGMEPTQKRNTKNTIQEKSKDSIQKREAIYVFLQIEGHRE